VDYWKVKAHGKDSKKEKNFIFQYSRNFSEQNFEQFSLAISKESWLDVFNANVECKFDIFNRLFLHYFDRYFPKTLVRKNVNQKSWVTDELKTRKTKLIEQSNTARLHKDKNIKVRLKQSYREFKKKLIQSKKAFYDHKIKNSKNVIKETWKVINKEVGNKSNLSDNLSVKDKGKLCTNPDKVSNLFLNHFTKIENNSGRPQSPSTFNNTCDNKQFKCKTIDHNTLDKIVSNLKNKYSTGYDDVPIAIIKKAKDVLLKPLLHLVNSSLISGIFPEELKIAKIIPVHKKNCKNEVTNYRPIALLPAISKIFERAMSNQLLEYLESNGLLDSFQHGFRKGKSVKTATIEFIESVIDSIDDFEKAVGIFIDLSQAFDSISHEILLERLRSLGVQGAAYKWFESYLLNRRLFVQVTHLSERGFKSVHNSKMITPKCGIPQGSILGPILFICYLKGIPQLEGNSKIVFYADDANVKISASSQKEIETLTELNMSTLIKHFRENNLLININKTNFITFTTQQGKSFHPVIKLDNQLISQSSGTKFLGLAIDQHLNWSNQVTMIQSRISSGLFALRKMSYICSSETLKTIYFAYIHSIISFGISLYGATSNKNMDSILKLQKQAIRIILHLDFNESVKEHFSSLNIMTVYSLYVFETVMWVKENHASLLKLGYNHEYNTRNKDKLCLKKHNLEFYCKKPSYIGAKFYNKLPHHIQLESNINKFKGLLKTYLITRALYSINEFFQSSPE